MYEFRWIPWNVDHIGKHDISTDDAEYVINHAKRPWPESIDNGKIIVKGQAEDGAYLQVIYLLDEDGTVFVVHARPLTGNEKRQLRRRQRR